jgi:hypothetical protein
MAHQCDFVEIQHLNDRRQIVGVSIHVVPGRGLAGPPMAPPIVRKHTEPVLREKKHLAVPSI